MKLAIIFFITISFDVLAYSDYCDGYKEGYKEGICDAKSLTHCSGYSVTPPLCPLPELGKNKYRDGYNRGFKEALRKEGNRF